MSITVEIIDRGGTVHQEIDSESGLVNRQLERILGDESYSVLSCIDYHGDTTFNQLQIHQFLQEWERLTRSAVSDPEKYVMAQVRQFALKVTMGVDLYLRFRGD